MDRDTGLPAGTRAGSLTGYRTRGHRRRGGSTGRRPRPRNRIETEGHFACLQHSRRHGRSLSAIAQLHFYNVGARTWERNGRRRGRTGIAAVDQNPRPGGLGSHTERPTQTKGQGDASVGRHGRDRRFGSLVTGQVQSDATRRRGRCPPCRSDAAGDRPVDLHLRPGGNRLDLDCIGVRSRNGSAQQGGGESRPSHTCVTTSSFVVREIGSPQTRSRSVLPESSSIMTKGDPSWAPPSSMATMLRCRSEMRFLASRRNRVSAAPSAAASGIITLSATGR
jgi:hypothetical protein